MSDIPIPSASLARLRTAYQQFLDLASVISDAMGIPPEAQRQLQLDRGTFTVETDEAVPNGLAAYEAARDGTT